MPKKNTPPTPPTEHRPQILFLDLATSSFRAPSSVILEVAAILADAATLDVIATGAWLVKQDARPDGAPDFHEQLIDACLSSPEAVSLARVEGELIAGPWLKADAVCNRNLYFDRQFLVHHMPNAARYLPRAEVDISGIEVLARALGVPAHVPGAARTYRAGDDVVDAYEALLHYRAGMAAALVRGVVAA